VPFFTASKASNGDSNGLIGSGTLKLVGIDTWFIEIASAQVKHQKVVSQNTSQNTFQKLKSF